jgi:hypothetical protein
MSTLDLDPITVGLPRPGADADRHGADAVRLWTGGLVIAVVAALIGFGGSLVVQAVGWIHLVGARAVVPVVDTTGTLMLSGSASVAALAATALAHALLSCTPRPLAYLSWIVGLGTAAATVLPLTGPAPLVVALAEGGVHLLIGLAIGSLVTQATISAGGHSLD